jgi:ABC-type multidrug transport system fused ATPase/permease subunit
LAGAIAGASSTFFFHFRPFQPGTFRGDLLDFFAVKPVVSSSGAIAVRGHPAGFEFRNVSFAYRTDEVLSSVNFKLPPGEQLLVGGERLRKTTIVKLLTRLYDPRPDRFFWTAWTCANTTRRFGAVA